MKKINNLLEELKLDENINLDDIPNIDLYMDQVIQLFQNKLSVTTRNEDEKILTKTMINNYSKGKLLMPIKNKKYTKNHIIMMNLIYEMKGCLSINDIKTVLEPIVKNYENCEENPINLEEIYSKYLHILKDNEEKISENILNNDIELEEDGYEHNILLLLMLLNRANVYRRLSERIIDNIFK